MRSDSTIADLHYIIQIAMGWADEHLHHFIIHGVHYGINYIGSAGFIDNAHEGGKLAQFGLREREKSIYEYDFCDSWKHQIRVEAILPELFFALSSNPIAPHHPKPIAFYFWGIADRIARSALFTSSEVLKTLATSGSNVTVTESSSLGMAKRLGRAFL